MRADSRVVLASNRGPISFVERDGRFETKRGAGGLAGALDPVARQLGDNATWIAAATSETDRKALASKSGSRLSDRLGYELQLLDIDPGTYSAYYDEISNRMLWFAVHDLWAEVGISNFDGDHGDAWDAYVEVNEAFADAVARVAQAGTLVALQDYHLALAPGAVRKRAGDVPILHFTHSAFSGPEGFALLPEEITYRVVEGMLGADLIGFHVDAWCRGFMRSCTAIGADVDTVRGTVTWDGHTSWIRAYPIPIDPLNLRERAARASVMRWADTFRPLDGQRLIVRADRCEPSKNIVRGFHAFGRLLEDRPDLYGKVRFVACLYPSRESMEEYRVHEKQVRAAVDAVNARYPEAVELFLSDDFDRTLGALSAYDVLLVNPIRDGMNLVSKEGALLNQREGILVLSRGAGSFDELGDAAVTIDDPLDVARTAAALGEAIDMDGHLRAERSRVLASIAAARSPEAWIGSQLDDLERVRAGEPPLTPPPAGPES